jgi:hypothetical protein
VKRREFLKASATGLVGAAAGEVQASAPVPTFDPATVEAKLERIDKRMAWFTHHEMVPRAPKTPLEATLFEERSRLARTAFRSFYFTGAFLDLSETEQMHPGVQERVARIQPDMEHAVSGMADFLAGMTPERRRIIQKELQDKPQIGDDIVQMFHRTTVEDRFGLAPQLDMRLAFGDLTTRMKTQNPSLLIDPCIQKVRKIQANAGRDAARERDQARREGESRFWALEERLAGHVRAWDRVYAARPRTDLARIEASYPSAGSGASADYYRTHPDSPGSSLSRARQTLTTGGYIMGFGAGSAATGALFYGLAAATAGSAGAGTSGFIYPAIVLGVTVGPILLAVGLIVVIVGGIWYLNVRPTGDEPAESLPADAGPRTGAPSGQDSVPAVPREVPPPDAPDDAPSQL